MVEKVHTGGTTEFQYKKGKKFKLEKEREQAIEDAYEKARIRKARERKRNLIILIILLILITLGLILFYT